MAEEQLKQILPLMTADPHGRLSRQEYMHFMEAEFDRLDKDKKGELDVRALAQSINVSVNRFAGK
jgi:Ca2+-binding EF-hand superfamily protein